MAVSVEHLLEVGLDDVCLKQARVEVWSLQEGEMMLFHVDTLLPCLAPSRVKSLGRSWSQLCLEATLVYLQQNYFQVVISLAKCTQAGFSRFLCVLTAPSCSMLLLFHFLPKRPFKFQQRARLQSSFGLSRLVMRLCGSLKAQAIDAAIAEQLIGHTRISMSVSHVEPMLNPG